MPGTPATLGPFLKGLHNGAGTGEYIDDQELFDLVNLEVDTDGSLANRPAINTVIIGSATTALTVMGVFATDAGKRYVCVSTGTGVALIDSATNTIVSTAACVPGAVVQYNNKLYIASSPTGGTNGGYFDASVPPVFTAVAAMPKGEGAAIYNDRMFVTAGVTATTNTSRLYFSNVTDPTTWPGINFVDIEVGNGQKLVSLLVLNNDIILFKEHSTYRAGYTSDIAKIEISKINSNIGVPAAFCAVTYDNNNIYVIHDNSVYELYNYTYTKLSQTLNMDMTDDAAIFAAERTNLTLFRNRLFVRFHSHFYVYNLLSGQWCRWSTTKKFSRLVFIPLASGDVAYASPSITAANGTMFTFIDNRVTGVGTNEVFNCSIITKTYDFDVHHAYKVLFWWGMTIATSGNTDVSVSVPNAGKNPTWQDWSTVTWASLSTTPWSKAVTVAYSTSIPSEVGTYGRKFLKFNRKIRLRQGFFTITTAAQANTVADACVRIYELTAFIKAKETVTYRTT